MLVFKRVFVLAALLVIFGAGVSHWPRLVAAESVLDSVETAPDSVEEPLDVVGDSHEGLDEFVYMPYVTQAPCSRREDEGMILIEVEQAIFDNPQWVFEQGQPGYLGSGYMTWRGPDLFGDPDAAVAQYPIWVENPGDYLLRIRNWHYNDAPDLENDVWVRMDGMDGEPWVKLFSVVRSIWNWHSWFDLGGHNFANPIYNLTVGYHMFEISARSYGFSMDRISLYQPGTPGEDDSLPPSACLP